MLAATLMLAAAGLNCTNMTALDVVRGRVLTGQVHVLTGGDSGIGFQTALALASADATVIIASYDAAGSGARAAANITATTGNSKVRVVAVDLSNLTSVHECAAAVSALTDRIDVLVADAGIGDVPGHLSAVTDDGLERILETNYVGHVLLADLLSAVLRRSGGRLVHVSSDASFDACGFAAEPANCTTLAALATEVRSAGPTGNNSYGTVASNYGISKYLQVFHAREVSRLGLPAFSLHPGFVATPMTKTLPPATVRAWCGNHKPCPLTAAQGGATPTYLASAPLADLTGQHGGFFTDCVPGPSVYDVMAKAEGSDAAAQYQSAVYQASMGWARA